MRVNTDDRLDRIESHLREVRVLLVILIAMSPVGLFCLATFAKVLGLVGGFWVAMALSIVGVLILCVGIARTRGRRMHQLDLDLLEKALKDRQEQEKSE